MPYYIGQGPQGAQVNNYVYLQGSSEDEDDYNPEGEEVPEDDDIIPSSEGEEGEGPSLKRPRLDPSPKPTPASDSD